MGVVRSCISKSWLDLPTPTLTLPLEGGGDNAGGMRDGFVLTYTVTGFGLFGSMPYFLIASATTDASIVPSSASAFSAATVT